ncbi:XAC2610-related protein [Leeuwenhoekiella blandensis]|uniref:Putative nitrite reductase n=1 Tax=Leeuwenhoekiella blandensis (strain CECT 7118 / CCUG 51940 / KCTC 22103 / MED217) TaxID=398720 RepID=A3XIA5_LEEBM|nr:hypothetical protein [Leeuwenhoekiella blandensis]EAQ50986.1 putative nitrite reductase [Leeuwenhoekiella blandensis MED217]
MKKILLILIILFSFELYSQEIIKFSDAEFEFCLTKKCGKTDCEITKIEVLKNGILKQTIKPSENYFSKTFPNDQLFAIEDMNFDGKMDFRLMEFLPAGPNVPFLFWIYNPTNELFEENKDYGEITSPEFDYEKKQINSTWRNGCCEHGRDVYELTNGIPKLTERFVIGHNSEDKEYYEHWKVENGELKLIEKTVE